VFKTVDVDKNIMKRDWAVLSMPFHFEVSIGTHKPKLKLPSRN